MNNELYLRAMEPEDLDVLYQVENDRELWNVGVTNVPYSRQALQHFIANTTYDIYTDKQVRMMACVNQQVIGICDLVDFNPSHSRAEVGIMVMEPYRHQGYATRILQQLAVYAHDVLHLHQLYAYVDVDYTFRNNGKEKTMYALKNDEELYDAVCAILEEAGGKPVVAGEENEDLAVDFEEDFDE